MKKLGILISTFLASMIFAAPLALAVTGGPNEQIDCSAAPNSAFCEGRKVTGNPLFGTDGILTKVAQALTVITGIISMYIITLAGFRFIRSGGDPQKVESARNALLYAAIGVVITISAQAIITLVLNKL